MPTETIKNAIRDLGFIRDSARWLAYDLGHGTRRTVCRNDAERLVGSIGHVLELLGANKKGVNA